MRKLTTRSEREKLEILFIIKKLKYYIVRECNTHIKEAPQKIKNDMKEALSKIFKRFSEERTYHKKVYNHVDFILDLSFKDELFKLIEDWNSDINTPQTFSNAFNAALIKRFDDWNNIKETDDLEKPEQNLPILSITVIQKLLSDHALREEIFSFRTLAGRGPGQYEVTFANILKALYNNQLDFTIAEHIGHGAWTALPLSADLTPAQSLAQLVSGTLNFSEENERGNWVNYQKDFISYHRDKENINVKFLEFTEKLENLKRAQQILFPYGALLSPLDNNTSIGVNFANKKDANNYSKVLEILGITESTGDAKYVLQHQPFVEDIHNYYIILTKQNIAKIMEEGAEQDVSIDDILSTHRALLELATKRDAHFLPKQSTTTVHTSGNSLFSLARPEPQTVSHRTAWIPSGDTDATRPGRMT